MTMQTQPFTLSVQGFKPAPGSLVLPDPVPLVQYWRVPHDIERVNVNTGDRRYRGNLSGYAARGGPVRQAVITARQARPEVYRLDPDHQTVLDCACQKLWKDLNPELSATRWATLLGNDLAFTNSTGFPGRYNCLTGEDRDQNFPRFHAPIVCGGALLGGVEQDGRLLISSMLITQSILAAVDVLPALHWWFWFTSVNMQGEINLVTRVGMDGLRKSTRVPFLTARPVSLPLSELHKLPSGFIPPDPKWMP